MSKYHIPRLTTKLPDSRSERVYRRNIMNLKFVDLRVNDEFLCICENIRFTRTELKTPLVYRIPKCLLHSVPSVHDTVNNHRTQPVLIRLPGSNQSWEFWGSEVQL